MGADTTLFERYGYTKTEWSSGLPKDYANALRSEELKREINQIIKPCGFIIKEFDLETPTGKFRQEISLIARYDSDGIKEIIGFIRDIEARNLLPVNENSLLEKKDSLEKEKNNSILDIIEEVCHDMNQPLQAIIGYSEIISCDIKDEDMQDMLSEIRTQALRLSEITKKLRVSKDM